MNYYYWRLQVNVDDLGSTTDIVDLADLGYIKWDSGNKEEVRLPSWHSYDKPGEIAIARRAARPKRGLFLYPVKTIFLLFTPPSSVDVGAS